VYGDTVYEAIPASGYTCSYTFNGLSGDTIDIRLVKRTNTLDPYLELYDPYGTLIAYDDDGGGNSNSWIRSQSLSDTGTYTIVASGYNLASSGQFMLTLTQD
nr:hypothetical protein [Caldilineaceae bacterium]